MFKNIKSGDMLHVIEVDSASGIPTYYATSVINVVPEYLPTNSTVLSSKVIDIVCKLGLESKTLSMIDPQSANIVVGNYKIGTDKDWAMCEIRTIHDVNKNIIASVERCEAIINACTDILEVNGLSPESDSQRLSSLEGSMNEMRGDMTEIKTMLSSLFNELKPEKNETTQGDK